MHLSRVRSDGPSSVPSLFRRTRPSNITQAVKHNIGHSRRNESFTESRMWGSGKETKPTNQTKAKYVTHINAAQPEQNAVQPGPHALQPEPINECLHMHLVDNMLINVISDTRPGTAGAKSTHLAYPFQSLLVVVLDSDNHRVFTHTLSRILSIPCPCRKSASRGSRTGTSSSRAPPTPSPGGGGH